MSGAGAGVAVQVPVCNCIVTHDARAGVETWLVVSVCVAHVVVVGGVTRRKFPHVHGERHAPVSSGYDRRCPAYVSGLPCRPVALGQ